MPSKPLRIAIYSPAFHPRLGGLETVVEVLATELSKLGQEVTVITKLQTHSFFECFASLLVGS